MAQHKKHHYVPRFYLKLFSNDGLSINLFNIPSQRTVHQGNLKNQCYRDYLYGKDQQPEIALGTIEGLIATVLKRISSDGALPVERSDRLVFLLHVLMQHVRTAYSVDAFDEQTDKFMKHLMAPKIEELGIDSKKFKITYKDSARFALALSTPHYPLLIDLKWKLLRASGNEEFITSDNPVVHYNQLLYFRNFGSNTGLVSKGLQIFFPVSPKYVVLLYDDKVYGVGNRKPGIVDVTDARDVQQLNRLQFVSALENVYFHDVRYSALQEFQTAKTFLRREKTRMQVFVQEETETRRKELVAMSREDVRTDLELSFVRLLKPAKEWLRRFRDTYPQPAAVVRNEGLLRDHGEFMELVKAGRYTAGDFFKYIQERYGK